MNVQRSIAGLTITVSLLAGCAAQTASNLPSPLTPAAETAQPQPPQAPFQAPAKPSAIAAAAIQPAPVPNLIPSVASGTLPATPSGRSDPFAALDVTSTIVINPKAASAPGSFTVPGQPQLPSSIPTVTVSALPAVPTTMQSLPIQPTATSSNSLPAVNLPAARVMPAVSLAQAIEISGVVQAGGKTSVIVKVPDEQSSRYVTVGDYLANGRVLVKRVVMGSEPTVILEQDGKEVSRFVGGSVSQRG